jgi:hypothetical protein
MRMSQRTFNAGNNDADVEERVEITSTSGCANNRHPGSGNPLPGTLTQSERSVRVTLDQA